MTVRWSPEAAADFAAIVEYIRKQNPSGADPCIGGHSADRIQMGIESLQFLLHQQWKCSWPRKITFLAQDMKQVRQRRPNRVYAALTRGWAPAHRQMLRHEPVFKGLINGAKRDV